MILFLLHKGREGRTHPKCLTFSHHCFNCWGRDASRLGTDVFISSPVRQVPRLSFHALKTTEPIRPRVLRTPLVPLWAGRQRKPSTVTGNETLGLNWKAQNTHMKDPHGITTTEPFSLSLIILLNLRETAEWHKLISYCYEYIFLYIKNKTKKTQDIFPL